MPVRSVMGPKLWAKVDNQDPSEITSALGFRMTLTRHVSSRFGPQIAPRGAIRASTTALQHHLTLQRLFEGMTLSVAGSGSVTRPLTCARLLDDLPTVINPSILDQDMMHEELLFTTYRRT